MLDQMSHNLFLFQTETKKISKKNIKSTQLVYKKCAKSSVWFFKNDLVLCEVGILDSSFLYKLSSTRNDFKPKNTPIRLA